MEVELLALGRLWIYRGDGLGRYKLDEMGLGRDWVWYLCFLIVNT